MTEHMPDEKWLAEMQAMRKETLLPELAKWVEEDGPLGAPMLRHPLVYDMFVTAMPGQTNRAFLHKKERLAEALAEEDWQSVVFLHERPYRLKALLDYVIGHDEDGEIIPLCAVPEHWDLAADVWVDSENIEQNVEEWRALIGNGDCDLWLGTAEERAAFDALPDPIPAFRGGTVGDWSWTTDWSVAKFFAQRVDPELNVRHAMIPKADCFGYLTRRSEHELLVRLTPDRFPLVYPDQMVSGNDDDQ